jgi:sensor histidine kinase YesM
VIAAKLVDDTIQIDIDDDGVGLRQSRNLNRQASKRMTNGIGIGLQNIRERLNTLYGAAARLTVIDLDNPGCKATLTIPIHGVKNANSGADRG